MNKQRRTLVAAVVSAPLLATLVAPLGASAQNRGSGIAELNPPQPTEAKNKVEVLEFFWYGCIHCYNLEPNLDVWLKKLPADVEFRRVPAVLSERSQHDAAIFHTLDALGLVDKLHRPLFDAIHRDKLNTARWEALSGWLEKQKVDPKKFEAAFKSFGVQGRTKRSTRLTSDYRIDGTPAMAVHGRYVVSGSSDMLDSVDKLIAVMRKYK